MISYDEALAVLQNASPLKAEMVPLAKAHGRICAQTVQSKVLVQPFDNSAMDGFAVVAEEAKAGSVLPVNGSTVAGDAPGAGQGGAWE
ncbi:MAG: hypothetical protein ACPG80_01560, partial [Rickettsiales bacterium]